MIGLDCLLRHVGKQCIGAAEAHHRELREERGDVEHDVVRAEGEHDDRDGGEPQRETYECGRRELPPGALVLCR